MARSAEPHPATFDPRLSDIRLLITLSRSLLTSRSEDDKGFTALVTIAEGKAITKDRLSQAITTAHAVRDALLPLSRASHWAIGGLGDDEAIAVAAHYRFLRDDWVPAQIAGLHHQIEKAK